MRKKAEFFFRHNACCVGAGKIVWKGKCKVGGMSFRMCRREKYPFPLLHL